MNPNNTATLDHFDRAIHRKLELLRGTMVRWRGAKVGANFGLGRAIRLLSPACFIAGDHVTIGDFSYLECFSRRGVRIGHHTSIDRNLWLSCGGPSSTGSGFFEIGDHSYIGCNAVIGAGGWGDQTWK